MKCKTCKTSRDKLDFYRKTKYWLSCNFCSNPDYKYQVVGLTGSFELSKLKAILTTYNLNITLTTTTDLTNLNKNQINNFIKS